MKIDKRARWWMAGWVAQLVLLAVVGRVFADVVRKVATSVEQDRRRQVTVEMVSLHAKLDEIAQRQDILIEGQTKMLAAQIEQLQILREHDTK
jgi:hypothetical protein